MADSIYSFGLETEYNGVEDAKRAVKTLKEEIDKAGRLEIKVDEKELQKAKQHITALEQSISKAEQEGGNFSTTFNKELNKVQKEAKKTEKSIDGVEKEIKSLDRAARGGSGFSAISKSAKIATRDIQQTDTQLDKLKMNLQQGVGQTIAFAGIGAITSGASKMLTDFAKLDDIMMNISIVSGKSAGEMERYRQAAGETADVLGTLGSRYLDASLIYEQQGGEAAYYAKELAQATVVAANISQESTGQMSEYLTATINGFQLLKEKGGEAGTYITDVLAKLGAASGSDLAEIATGLTRTANTAKDVGFEFEEISTMIATVSEVTRRTPETIGNAFKSMLTSFTQLRAGSEEELNDFSNKVEQSFQMAGIENISVFDDGNLRDAADIFKDIGKQWDNIDKEGQSLVSEAVAGKYQAEVFRAFMNNQERYNDLLGDAYDSAGTAAMQQIVFMDSLEAKMNQMGNAWEEVSSAVIDSDMFKGLIEQLTTMFKLVGDSETSFGAIAQLAAPLAGIFAGTIGKGIGGAVGDQIWGSATSIKNIQKEYDEQVKLGHLTDQEREKKLEDLRIGQQQRELKQKMSSEDAAYYENLLVAQENLNDKIGVQNDLMKKASTEKGMQEIIEEIDTKGGVLGIDTSSFKADKTKGEQEAAKALSAEQEKLNALKQKAVEIGKADHAVTSSLEQVTKAKLERGLESMRIKAQGAKLDELEIKRQDLITKLKKTENSNNTGLVNLKKEIQVLSQEILNEEKLVSKEMLTQVDSEKKILQGKIEAAGKLEASKRVRSSIDELGDQTSREAAEAAALQAQQEATEKLYAKKQQLQKAVSGLSTAYSMITPIVNSFNGVMEGTITQSEGITNSLNSVSMGLMATANPWGVVAGVLVGAFSQISNAMGLFETAAEKTKKGNEELVRSFMSLDEAAGQKMTLLQDVQDSYARFEGLSPSQILADAPEGTSDEDLKVLNQNRTEYLELSEKIAKVSPELVKYYDDQGRAIVDLTGNYEDLVAKAKEEKLLVSDILAQNQDSFVAQLFGDVEGQTEKMDEATKKLTELNEERRKLQDEEGSSKELKENIADIQEQTNELSKASEEVKKAKDAVQAQIVKPYFEANRELSKLADSNKEIYNQAAEFAGEQFNQGQIMDMFNDGYEEGVINLRNNLDLVLTKVEELTDSGAPEEASKLIETLKGYSEESKKVIGYTQFEDITQLELALQEQEESFGKATLSSQSYVDKLIEVKNANKDAAEAQEASNKQMKEVSSSSEFAGQQSYAAAKTGWDKQEASENLGVDTEAITNGLIDIKEKTKEVSDTFKGANEEVDKLSKLKENMEDYLPALDEVKKSLEGIKSVDMSDLGDIDIVTGIGTGVSEEIEIAQDAVDNLKDKFPDLGEEAQTALDAIADGTISAEEGAEALGDAFSIAQAEIGANALGIMETNQTVFETWKEQNAERLALIQEEADIDIPGMKTAEELQIGLAGLSDKQYEATQKVMALSEEELDKAKESHKAKIEERSKGIEKEVKAEEDKQQVILTDAERTELVSKISNNEIVRSTEEMGQNVIKIYKGMTTAKDVFFKSKEADKIKVPKLDTKSMKEVESEAQKHFDKIRSKYTTEQKVGTQRGAEIIGASLSGAGGSDIISKMNADLAAEQERLRKSSRAKEEKEKENTRNREFAKEQEAAEKAAKEKERADKKAAREAERKKKEKERKEKAEQRKKEREAKAKAAKEKKKKAAESKQVENIKLELDKYVDLENQLKKVSSAMSDLKVAKDMAYGEDRIKMMSDEQKLLKQQADVSASYARRLTGEQTKLRDKLSKQGFGFSGADIKSQNATLKAKEKTVNAIKDPKAKEKAKDSLKDLQKDVDRYTEVTYGLIPDKKRAKEEARKAISDLAREKIEYQVKLKIDKTDLQRNVLSALDGFKQGFDNLDERMQLAQKSTKTYLDDIATYQKELRDVQKNSDLSDSEKQGMVSDIKNNIVSAVASTKGAYDQLAQIQKEFLTEAVKAIDTVASSYDKVISKSQTMLSLQKELYGSKNQKEVEKYYDIQEKAIEGSIASQQTAMSSLIKYRDTLDKSSESWSEANDAVEKLAENIEGKLMEKMKLLQTRWDDFVDGMLKKVDESFGTWGLDGARSEFDKLISQQETYMSGFEKLNTVGGKISEINKEIAKTADPAQAKALAEFRDKELQSLMSQDKVSKTEYERAMKLLEIKQKELAMTERENASRVAQVVRDQSGNISYEYVRGEETDTSAEYKELQKMKDDLMEFDESQVKVAGSKIFDIIADYQSKVKDLSDKGLSTEEYKKELAKLLKDSQSEMENQQAIIDKWMGNLGADGTSKLKDMFTDGTFSPEDIGLSEEQISKFFNGVESGQIRISEMLAGDSADFGQAMGLQAKEAEAAMKKIMDFIVGKNTQITDSLKETSDKWTSTASKNVTALGKEYEKYIKVANQTLERYNGTTDKLNKLLKETTKSSKQTTTTIDKQTQAMKTTTNATNKTATSVKNLEKMLIGSGSGGLFGSMVQLKNQMNSKLQPSLKATEKGSYKVSRAALDASHKMTRFSKESDSAYKKTKQFAGEPIKEANNQIGIMGKKSQTVYKNFSTMGDNAKKAQDKIGALKRELAALPGAENIARSSAGESRAGRGSSFATGGYTGTWSGSTGNQEGRMAVLHEKELVLNKRDTENILEAVSIQRRMMANINNRDVGTRSIINNQTSTNKVINNNSNERVIQSSPVINASFPDVRDSREIEKAFNGLFSKATTFVSGK